jgi:alpha-1,3-rhamnosyl/mannosyltransferase
LNAHYLYGIHWLYHLRRSWFPAGGTGNLDRPLVPGTDSGPSWASFIKQQWKDYLKEQASRLEYRLRRPQIYHATNYVANHWECPVVATIHDLSFVRYPETHPQERLDWLAEGLPLTLDKAHLIAVSQFTKQELMDVYNIPDDRITVIYEGLDSRFRPISSECASQRLKPFGLKAGDYILSLGTLEPRKNLIGLVEAYEQLPEATKNRYPLAVAGIRGWKDEQIHASFNRLFESGRIRLLGFVPDDDLPALYSGAALFVFPSFYEGFGFPPLEAMACGTPTLVSNRSSLPEMVGDGAGVVDPENPAQIAEAMVELLEDDSLRRNLSTRGIRRSAKYTWSRCAMETLDVYNGLLQDS